MAAKRCIVDRGDKDYDARAVDKAAKEVKNVWKWDWMERVVDGECLGKNIRKIKAAGLAFCELCQKEVNYGCRGWKALEQHIKQKVHTDNAKLRATNYSLSSVFGQQTKPPESVPYGIHPMFKAAAKAQAESAAPETTTPLCDRITNSEAMLLAFTAEHSLSFSLVPNLIELSKTLSRDKKALEHLSMSRTTASYKTRFGVGKTFADNLLEAMRSVPFSLNMDESTSSSFQKVLTVLVSYFCPVMKRVVVQHFASLTCIRVNSEALYNEIVKLFEINEVPWKNLMSILMDSCNVMRGSKSGLETRIREGKAPHLLDVDGDVCHHIHNAAKAFCKPFQWFLEQLLNDLFNDFKWSPDIREMFQEVCEMLGLKYTMPQRYVSHRWLSVYDVTVDTNRLFDAFTVFYFSVLCKPERQQHLPTVLEIYKRLNVSESSRERIREIRQEMSRKNLTKEGRERKNRIVTRIFTERRQTKMVIGLYSSVFPVLKNFVLLFEMKEPLIHQLYEQQLKLFKDFLGCYIKAEVINTASTGAKLKKLDLKQSVLKPEQMFMGARALKLVRSTSTPSHVISTFLKQVKEAYIACGASLQQKLPLTNKFLKAVSALHPDARGHSVTLGYLQKLPMLSTNVLTEEEEEAFDLEIRKYQTDELPEFPDGSRIDEWWGKQDICVKYPALCKMAKAALSCFHGPQVESSFNVMNDIIDAKSGKLNICTYQAIQNIKYGLKASGKTAVEHYQKRDYLHEKVDPTLVRNVRRSFKEYKSLLAEKQMSAAERKKQLDIKAQSIQTKRKAKELCEKAAKIARVAHHGVVE